MALLPDRGGGRPTTAASPFAQLHVTRNACNPAMSPDKLFDYLDGNLPGDERVRLEEQLLVDAQLQRQLAVAREIHKGMRGPREMLASVDDPQQKRGAILANRVGIAFIVLVFVNVFIGVVFIIGRHPRSENPQVRHQVTASIEKAAENALPPPSLADDIVISVPPNEREMIADKVVVTATQLGGSAAKALPNEHTTTVIAEIAASRETDFRAALVPLGAPVNSPPQGSPPAEARKLIQVQIKDRTS